MIRSSLALAALALMTTSPAQAAQGPKAPSVQSRHLALRFAIPPEMSQTLVPFAVDGPSLPIYLNRFETTYYGGYDDAATNHSSIVDGSQATVGGFSGSDAEWDEVVDCVRDQFARFHVVVSDIEPAGGDFVEAMIGGSPDQIDMPWGVGGVAPFDPYGCSVISGAVVYAFADVYQGGYDWTRAVCETATQEIAHAFSLDHQLLASDPMTYLDYDGDRSFKDEYVPCGEYEPRECACSGANQNSVQMLFEQLGAADGTEPPPPPDDLAPPTVEIVSPGDAEQLAANATIEIVAEATDDVAVTLLELVWDFSGESMVCPGAGGSWSCERAGSTYTWTISVGSGARTFHARATDVGGNRVDSDERTIWLSEDGSAMPDDELDPEVAIVSPSTGAVLPATTIIEIVAMAADDSGLSKVELNWNYTEDTWPCPMETDTVSCTVQGTTYTWHVQVGEGTRTFDVLATDLVGKTTRTATRGITLDQDAVLPVDDDYEGNDTWDYATQVACGQSLDMIATPGDADWFEIDPPDHMTVTLTTTGAAAAELALDARTTPLSRAVIAEGDKEVSFVAAEGTDDVRVRVTPGAETEGPYRVVVTCVAEPLDASTDEPVFATCACFSPQDGAPAAGFVLLGAGALLVRRRRR